MQIFYCGRLIPYDLGSILLEVSMNIWFMERLFMAFVKWSGLLTFGMNLGLPIMENWALPASRLAFTASKSISEMGGILKD